MTPTRLFKPATGPHPLTDVLNNIRDALIERTPIDGPEIIWDNTKKGFVPRLKKQPAQVTQEAGDARWS